MEIILYTSKDCNDSPIHRLVIDNKEVASIRDLSECPEDAHIGRDLIDGNDIIKYIKMGYGAAISGEEIVVRTQPDPEAD